MALILGCTMTIVLVDDFSYSCLKSVLYSPRILNKIVFPASTWFREEFPLAAQGNHSCLTLSGDG